MLKSKRKTEIVDVRVLLTAQTRAALDAACNAEDRKRSDLIRFFLKRGLVERGFLPADGKLL
jgi:hypothetical protein